MVLLKTVAAVVAAVTATAAPHKKPPKPTRLARIVGAANRITAHHYPYMWGGGHGSFAPPYDCSGAVSAVLHAGRVLSTPEDSGTLESYGQPGPGTVTIYANAGHVFMRVRGRLFGTGANAAGGPGWLSGWSTSGYVVRHVPAALLEAR